MVSSEAGHQDIVKILLAFGANKEAVSSVGTLNNTLTVRIHNFILSLAINKYYMRIFV